MKIQDCDLKDETVLEIGRFAILWNYFENYCCKNNCNPTTIRKISRYIQLDMKKQAHFAAVLNGRRGWIGQDEVDYVKKSLHFRNARMSNEEDTKFMCDFLKQQNNSSVCGCLLVICRIRNNLMHGIKLLDELNNQIELFRAANEVLESIKMLNVC